jgi:hypothetical protein
LKGFAFAASRFSKLTCRQSPALARSTSGRGRLSGRKVTAPAVNPTPGTAPGITWPVAGSIATTSRFSAYIM